MLLHENNTHQLIQLESFLKNTAAAAAGDDKLWLRRRNEILWLHDWSLEFEQSEEGTLHNKGRGPFGQIDRVDLQKRILTALINNSRKSCSAHVH